MLGLQGGLDGGELEDGLTQRRRQLVLVPLQDQREYAATRVHEDGRHLDAEDQRAEPAGRVVPEDGRAPGRGGSRVVDQIRDAHPFDAAERLHQGCGRAGALGRAQHPHRRAAFSDPHLDHEECAEGFEVLHGDGKALDQRAHRGREVGSAGDDEVGGLAEHEALGPCGRTPDRPPVHTQERERAVDMEPAAWDRDQRVALVADLLSRVGPAGVHVIPEIGLDRGPRGVGAVPHGTHLPRSAEVCPRRDQPRRCPGWVDRVVRDIVVG